MLVRISDSYGGAFGLYNNELGQVDLKTRDSDPFELLPDSLAAEHIKSGVCVAVGRIPGGALPSSPESEAKPAETLPESSAADDGVEDPDEDDADELDLAAMPFKELKELAKSYGINPTGMKRAAVEEAVSEAMGGPPALAAEDPE